MAKPKSYRIGRIVGKGPTMAAARVNAERAAAEAIERLAEGPLFGKLRHMEMFAAASADNGAHYGFIIDPDGVFRPRIICEMRGTASDAFAAAARHAASLLWTVGDDDAIADEVVDLVQPICGPLKAEQYRSFLVSHFDWHRRYAMAKAAGLTDAEACDRASGLHAPSIAGTNL